MVSTFASVTKNWPMNWFKPLTTFQKSLLQTKTDPDSITLINEALDQEIWAEVEMEQAQKMEM